jgi:hypothetical protein
MAVEELKNEPMMAHLLASLDRGEDIGHYGRLTFVMVARHFLSDEEIIAWLTRVPGIDEEQVRNLLRQVAARGYNPPKRERVLEWMRKQDFPICPEPDDRGQCNVYRNLEFPREVYEKIAEYYKQGGN